MWKEAHLNHLGQTFPGHQLMTVSTLPWSEVQGTYPILAFLGVAVDTALNRHACNICEQTKNNKQPQGRKKKRKREVWHVT